MIEPLPLRVPPTADDLGKLPDHTSIADMEMMASAIRALTGEDRVFFGLEMFTKDLMFFKVEKPIEDLFEAARMSGRMSEVLVAMWGLDPSLLDDFIEATAEHCVNGLDLTDEKSAGGWNAEECANAYASLYVARRGLSVPFGANVQ